jgi:hypothetical protein
VSLGVSTIVPTCPARKVLGGQIGKQHDGIKRTRLLLLDQIHHNTQQVTNRGKPSLARMIQIVLTTASRLSFDKHIDPPSHTKCVRCKFEGIVLSDAVEQRLSQPRGIGTFQTESAPGTSAPYDDHANVRDRGNNSQAC